MKNGLSKVEPWWFGAGAALLAVGILWWAMKIEPAELMWIFLLGWPG